MFLILLAIVAVLVVVIMLLPVVSGLGTYRYEPRRTRSGLKRDGGDGLSVQQEEQNVFIPLEERLSRERASKAQGRNSRLDKLKEISSITKDSIPLKFHSNVEEGHGSVRNRKRTQVLDANRNDPDSFDYDLDELINEEEEEERREQKKEWEEIRAKSRDDLEEMA